MSTAEAPELNDGIIAVVKRDCPTCELVAPVLEAIAEEGELTTYTQDDPSFPASASWVRDDTALAFSWHHDIETVPTLIRVVNGAEVERVVGWQVTQWQTFFGDDNLGEGLPEYRPGCGSLSVDPNNVDRLEATFGGSGMSARRVEFGSGEDVHEAMIDRGWTDGLPVVAPTPERVAAMLRGTTRSAEEIVATVAPNLAEASVEKVAINAVLAGCTPEYLPVVIAALQAICTDEFNIHGVLATTMGVGPIFVVNGPIRQEIGMNSGINVLGHGNRANATIGRAVQLCVRNIGGGAPGGIDRAAQGNPGKLGLCFAEDEEGSPWESMAVERGFDPGVSTVTAFCGEGPRLLFDQVSRSPESLTRSLAKMMLSTVSPRMVMGIDAMLVLSPEHANRYREAGWSKAAFREALNTDLLVATDDIIAGVDGIDEGMPASMAGLELPKFNPDGGLNIVHAGGPAGLFSSIIGGWLSGPGGSVAVTKEITR
jgi:hypothetical protein